MTEKLEPKPGLHGQHLLGAILSVKTDGQEELKGPGQPQPGEFRGCPGWVWVMSPTHIAYSVAVCPGIRHWGSRKAACSGRA
jgi:hypothetical protein